MKLLQLFERRIQKTQKMFHGTSSVFLKNILAHGLLANPDKRSYDGDEDHGEYFSDDFTLTFSLEPIEEGVYLTPNYMYARDMATHTTLKFGGEPIILTIQYVKGSGIIDEDEFLRITFKSVFDNIQKVLSKELIRKVEIDDEYEKYEISKEVKAYLLSNIRKDITREYMQSLGVPNHIAIENSIKIAEGIIEGIIEEHENSLPLYYNNKNLTKKIMNNIKRNRNSVNVVVARNIGFKGKTRIIKIEMKGNEGNKIIYDESPVYGKRSWSGHN